MGARIVLTGATGKIGGAVLSALLEYELVSPSDLVIATSSQTNDSRLGRAITSGVTIKRSNYNSVELMTEAFAGCERLFLVSTPEIALDFDDCAKGGREKQHISALKAAKQAGVSHVYYTSLAFQDPSKAAVMRAHLETEQYLKSQKDFDFTIIREGIYSESWPLYLGHFNVKGESRDRIVIGPDGPINWTSIPDLGLASALIVTGDRNEWTGRTLYLSNEQTMTIAEVASLVSKENKKQFAVEEKSQDEYIEHYTTVRAMDKSEIEWWSSTYPALKDNECRIAESPLKELLASKGREAVTMSQIIHDMFTRE